MFGMDILNKPIGLIMNNNQYTIDALSHNIGHFNKDIGIYGNDIGFISDFEYNSTNSPWFKLDDVKSNANSYVDYIEELYYNGEKQLLDFFTMDEKMSMHNPYTLDTNFNHVGVIRSYNYFNKYSYGNVNPNSLYSDTKLGYINNFYLSNTINNSILESYKKPSNNGMGITKGIYDKFSIGGEYGMIYGAFHEPFGFVENQNNIVGNTIYLTNTNNLGLNHNNSLVNSSMGLVESNSERTNNFIVRSLLGMDLLINPYDYLTLYNLDDNLIDYSKNKKYHPAYNFGNSTYVDSIAESYSVTDDGKRYVLKGVGVNVLDENNRQKQYQEREGGSLPLIDKHYSDSELYSGNTNNNRNDLIRKTNQLFKDGKIDSLIGRFHSDNYDEESIISTAKSKNGYSRGRNLLKKGIAIENGYDNPYCRVWTYDKQYKSLSDTIRNKEFTDELNNSTLLKYRNVGSKYNGSELLKNYGVKNENSQIRFGVYDNMVPNNPKACMFSLENLAWKDDIMQDDLDADQKGYYGGRIMWFPPYDLKFNENVSVKWDSTSFIGRGEDIYTYVNTMRGGNLSFKLLIDYPSMINDWAGTGFSDKVDDVDDGEQSILRFFAGCDIINDPKTYIDDDVKLISDEIINNEEQLPISTEKVTFVVYFPNNFSGIDKNIVNPIDYLYNGISTNKEFVNGINSDFTVDVNSYYDSNGKIIGGYEIFDESLSSWITDDLNENIVNGKVIAPFNIIEGNKLWYRVDNSYKNHKLSVISNYKDSKSFHLNSDGFLDGIKKIDNSVKENECYSFVDVYDAMNGVVNGFYNIIRKHRIKEVNLVGFASSHGAEAINYELAKNRANTIEKWLRQNTFFYQTKFKKDYGVGDVKNYDINSFDAKVWRSVKVEIIYETQETSNLMSIIHKENSQLLSDNDFIQSLEVNNASQKMIEDHIEKIKKRGANDSITKERLNNILNIWNTKVSEYINRKNEENIITQTNTDNRNRYRDEYKFFSELETNEPFLYQMITKKIKYFNPAYHSVSPEGFQSRLTFLHQCTRQGSTIGGSDIGSGFNNAYNLAFGKPPICILRIGDFFNTKIIIESLSIQYDNTTWDMNPEGIGVMPMIADVNISFKFIGGSDIAGPIAKLQNALSFNYYANTSVYDNRADVGNRK